MRRKPKRLFDKSLRERLPQDKSTELEIRFDDEFDEDDEFAEYDYPVQVRSDREDGQEPVVYQLVEYEITEEPITEKRLARYPKKVHDEVERLNGLMRQDPAGLLAEIPEWIEKYPDLPVLQNYLACAHQLLGHEAEATKIIEEMYRRFPDYLFGRVNYAQLLLERKDYEGFAAVFDNKFDLALIYPERRKFHVSEYISFAYVMGCYYHEVDNPRGVSMTLESMETIAPESPHTRKLARIVRGGRWNRLANSIFRATTKREGSD